MLALLPALVALAAPAATASPQDPRADGPAPERRIGRPAPGAGPTEVRVGLYVVDVFAVDDASESFTADLLVVQRWRDPRLAGIADATERARLSVESVWTPRVVIVNQKALSSSLEDELDVGPRAGDVVYRRRLIGEFTSPLDLRRFPLDAQTLGISFVSLGYSPGEVSLLPDEEWTGSRADISPAGWEIELGRPRVASEPVATQGRSVERLDFPLGARRVAGFYYFKVFLPLSLIVLMAWCVFWIDPREPGPQIGVATSSVFTLIAFQLVLGSALPKVAYLTNADRFLLGATILVFVALGRVDHDRAARAPRARRASAAPGPGLPGRLPGGLRRPVVGGRAGRVKAM